MQVILELGDKKLSVEGESKEVAQMLEQLLPILQAPATTESNNRRPSSGPKRKTGGAASQPKDEPNIDAEQFANQLKANGQFTSLWKAVLNTTGNWTDKARLVAFFAERPITSGDVKRVMDALKVKSTLPAISKALSATSSEYLTTGSNPVSYELTATAREKFQGYLQGLEKQSDE